MEQIVLSDLTKVELPVMAGQSGQGTLENQLNRVLESLIHLDQCEVRRQFQLESDCRMLKTTISLCPTCLSHIPAAIYSSAGKVWMRKECPKHAHSTCIIENDEAFYFLSNKYQWGRCYAEDRVLRFPAYGESCCGGACDGSATTDLSPSSDYTVQSQNKSCTVLVEVANACNLKRKVCYSDAKGDRVLPISSFKQYMTRLIEQKGVLDSVQLTGGEAILHPQFWDMVDFLYRQDRVLKIYLPTNGILFSRPENA